MKTQVERTIETIEKLEVKISKAYEAIEKAEKKLEKINKLAEVKEVISKGSFSEWWDNQETKIASLGFDYSCKLSRADEMEKEIERYKKRLLKYEEEENEREEKREGNIKERIRAIAFEEGKDIKDIWKADEINVEQSSINYISGTTPSGKYFDLSINMGETQRSNHCYRLWLDGKMIFSSGTIYRAYHFLKNN